MELTSFTKKDGRIRFNIKGVDVGMANALRRTIISQVPAMAIEKVRFHKNSSILNNEILAHRLGLMPLTTDLAKARKSKEYVVTLKLDVAGPKTVHASEMTTSDDSVKPVYGDTPIIKLTETQKLKLEADAVLGTGADHIKWQAGLASYENQKIT